MTNNPCSHLLCTFRLWKPPAQWVSHANLPEGLVVRGGGKAYWRSWWGIASLPILPGDFCQTYLSRDWDLGPQIALLNLAISIWLEISNWGAILWFMARSNWFFLKQIRERHDEEMDHPPRLLKLWLHPGRYSYARMAWVGKSLYKFLAPLCMHLSSAGSLDQGSAHASM